MPKETVAEAYVQDLDFKGFIQGLTIKDKNSGKPLCRYFGGIPYAQPPTGEHRWQKPRELAPCYRYGTRADPAPFAGKSSVCPQLAKKIAAFDENCLQCNVWVPSGEQPPQGWPVYFYIHGGFLQMGNVNSGNPTAFISEISKCIVVKPAYRLNVFGFLASTKITFDQSTSQGGVGNFGFWDIRLALEWTFKNISYFGGNPANITVGGYSAGAHAAFYQLAYDLYQPSEKRLIRRLIMHSNGPGLPPRGLEETQAQFGELLQVLQIPANANDKMQALRQKSPEELLEANKKMQLHQFRAVSDGDFVRHTLFSDIEDGTFARRMQEGNIQLLIGECSDEHFSYRRYRPPQGSYDTIMSRLQADYPRIAVAAAMRHYFPEKQLPPRWKTWSEAFGWLYAYMQIHVSERGFIDSLARGGAAHLIHRYRIEWRAECADLNYPKEGASHGADNYLWWFGDGLDLTPQEQVVAKSAFLNDMSSFINSGKINWGSAGVRQVRRLKANGQVDLIDDEFWDEAVESWRGIMTAALTARGKSRL
ncbi:paraben-hydrolyzing esterase precursor [Microthyrium microscopicum]|uniref:Carboxylic ester hydrolase n=1 Tax=Microthyrium microscopicum TaxID=703497 RepID=A0A6A6UUV2_9PEZI|nr:paraben-hydrolyzing esterase precursor [Microthyrium microscopicum]